MILDGIDVFTEVADAQSFTRAAQRLGMPTTTVSAKVARLEDRLGVTLIHRTTRSLQLTEAGKAYYARCVRALAEVSEAERELARLSEEPAGLLRITAPPDLARSLLVPIVRQYLDRYPQVNLQLVITNDRLNLISEGIDLAVRIGRFEDSSLVIRKFVTGKMALWASKAYLDKQGYPRTFDDLKDHRFISVTPFGSFAPLKNRKGEEINMAFKGRLEVDDLSTVQSFLEDGEGIGALPLFEVAGGFGNGRLVQILPAYASDPVSAFLVYPTQRFVPPTLRSFIDLATQMVKPVTADSRV